MTMNSPVLQAAQLGRVFGSTAALVDVTFEVPEGAVLGLVGENGAGKTTLIKHALGLLKPQQGSISLFGLDPVRHSAEVLGRIGYLSEQRDLPLWMEVREAIHYWSAFYPHWDRGYAADLLEMFELAPRQKLKTLSRGELARMGLLLAVAHRPELLLLDEPSSGLDPMVRRDILAAIIRAVADDGRTVIFSSHLLDEVQRVSDHLVLLHQGRVCLEGRLDELLESHERRDIRLPVEPVVAPQPPGAIACCGADRDWTVVSPRHVNMEDWIREQAAEVVDHTLATLDDLFAAHVGRESSP